MAFRFQRRVTLAPGVRVNFGLRGPSLSVGPRGASVSIGQRGIYSNAGIPGTGLSMRRRIDAPAGRTQNRSRQDMPADLSDFRMRVAEDGIISLLSAQEEPLSPAEIRRLRAQSPKAIESGLEQAVAAINADLDACMSVHLATPSPIFKPIPTPPGPGNPPMAPVAKTVGFWDRLLFRRAKIERENARMVAENESLLADWHQRVRAHEREALRIAEFNAGLREGRQEIMEAALADQLRQITWAKETQIAFDFGEDSKTLALDVDLPTLDEMPHRTASMPARGINLRMTKRSDPQRRRDFIRLVTGICFRVAGEAFARLPTVGEVTVTGFTQRIDPATGAERDVHVISVRIARTEWGAIDFDALSLVEPEQALERFRLRWKPTRNATLSEIEPH